MTAKNTQNDMTQREWDRIVGIGKVPEDPITKEEIEEADMAYFRKNLMRGLRIPDDNNNDDEEEGNV